MDSFYVAAAGVAAIAGLLLAAFFARQVQAADPGNERMIELMGAIREGSMAFLRRQYTVLAGFVAVVALLIFAIPDYRFLGAFAYLAGATASGSAGFIGMRIATAANARTAEAARVGGVALALPLAFRGGAVMGFTVAGLGLLGVTILFFLFIQALAVDNAPTLIAAFGLGASSIALFARVGGGIYTKAADVGADLVGKVEAGIPEDDPRNPAVIADNVGDNVGDVAGMGADLFESYVGSMVAPIVLGAVIFAGTSDPTAGIVFPLAVAGAGMIASIIGAFFVRTRAGGNLGAALHRGTNVAAALTAVSTAGLSVLILGPVVEVEQPLFFAGAIIGGLVAGLAIGWLSEYYTSDHFGPVKHIAEQARTGPATVILGGLSTGMRSTAGSIIVIVAAIVIAYVCGSLAMPDNDNSGIYGIALAAIGMLATTAITVSVDAYGPIADNAGGIAQMAHLPPEVRRDTDALDSLGNTTAAVAKGFAVGSAALTALALFRSFTETANAALIEAGRSPIVLDINDVAVTAGLFLGAMLPFLFAAITIEAVGRAANAMIHEVRRQFREIPGLKEGKPGVHAEYAKCVDISTAAALREMVVPGALAIVSPLVIGFISLQALGGFLVGALVSGFLLAIFMANAGGAWDNAKKYVEAGNLGGKGSDAHHAAVVGDTVGDPLKDTSGPSMNILIKVMSVVSLIAVPAFVAFRPF
ncbi:MAG TPA: sodium-translocating pyrophosphatase [Candidatus Binatia bacterium]|nr:sodium-translocating pyrophosphatase [Candidatus Binatia bacterium]